MTMSLADVVEATAKWGPRKGSERWRSWREYVVLKLICITLSSTFPHSPAGVLG